MGGRGGGGGVVLIAEVGDLHFLRVHFRWGGGRGGPPRASRGVHVTGSDPVAGRKPRTGSDPSTGSDPGADVPATRSDPVAFAPAVT